MLQAWCLRVALRAVASSSVVLLGLAATLALSAPAAQAQVSFLNAAFFDTAAIPISITIGDLDGDGDNDLAVAGARGAVNVSKNNGDGTFAASQYVYTGTNYPYAIASGDLDKDGDLDLVATGDPSVVIVLKNSGDGTFAAPQNYAVGDQPLSITVGDLDKDGDLDLATANRNSNNLSVLKNNGNGTFATPQNLALGGRPYSIAAGDLDGDGDLDLATGVLSGNYSTVAVLKNNGNGSFAAPQNFAGSGGILGDLDGDGDLDLVTSVAVLKNNGDGTFAAPQYFAGGGGPSTIGDLDGDGDLDLTTAKYNYSNSVSTLYVLKNNGNGTFAAPQSFTIFDDPSGGGEPPYAVTIGDLNGDGDLDIATTIGRYSGTIAVFQNTTPTLQLSLSPDRSNPVPLAGQTVKGNVYVFASGEDADFLRVRFFIDDPDKSGESYRLEQAAPFDLSGSSGSKANPSNSRALPNGTHTITATFARPDGTYRTVTSTFTIAN